VRPVRFCCYSLQGRFGRYFGGGWQVRLVLPGPLWLLQIMALARTIKGNTRGCPCQMGTVKFVFDYFTCFLSCGSMCGRPIHVFFFQAAALEGHLNLHNVASFFLSFFF